MIIEFSYDKAAAHPPGHGYDAHPDGQALIGIILHSTDHQPGQTFPAVCEYLRDSPVVSVHYVVGLFGEVQRVLDPRWRAWGAGRCRYQGRSDYNSGFVQIEAYHRAGGPAYTPSQLLTLRSLILQLRRDHPTIQRDLILAHRWVAYPPGRRADPTDWPDGKLRAWIATL